MLSASSASLTCHARTHDVRHRERLNFLGETRRYPRFRGRKSLFISYMRAYIRGLLRFHPAEARVRILRLKGARAARYNFTPGISKRRVRAKCTLRPRFMGRRRNRKGFEAWRNYYIADAYIYICTSIIKRESFDAFVRFPTASKKQGFEVENILFSFLLFSRMDTRMIV